MQTNGNTITEPKQVQQLGAAVPEKQYPKQQNMYGLGTNYSAGNKWFAYLPLENVLGKKYQNLDLHLTQFSLPQLVMGSTTVSFKGYAKEIPTKVLNAENKELTLSYIVDENWQNYRALFAWISAPKGALNPIINEDTSSRIQPSEYIPLRIYLLDNFKRKKIEFVFQDCWIKLFSDLQLDVSNPDEIVHSFTFCYSRYYIEDLDKI